MPQQTAVGWLIMQLPVEIRVELYKKNIHVQAKEMEKEQIMNSYKKGFGEGTVFGTVTIYKFQTSEDYYNETYQK